MQFNSKLGLLLALTYIIGSALLILVQGLTGESFIALLLGIPWSFGFAFFEYWAASGPMLYFLLILPLAVNAAIIYWIGSKLDRKKIPASETPAARV